MTWTKLGDEFSDECANTGLSDAAYRTHVEAIAWLYRVERMDLHIPKHLLKRFVGSEDWEKAVHVLVALDWWRDRGDHYQVVHHEDVIRQSIAAQQAKRTRDKRAQADKRRREDRKAQEVSDDVSADVIPDTDRQTDKHAVRGSADLPSDPRFWKQPHETEAQNPPAAAPASPSSPASFIHAQPQTERDHLFSRPMPGRCSECEFHVETQGHRDGCSRRATA